MCGGKYVEIFAQIISDHDKKRMIKIASYFTLLWRQIAVIFSSVAVIREAIFRELKTDWFIEFLLPTLHKISYFGDVLLNLVA